MAKKEEKIYVVGHKNPDTDSICSAIAYANLKREITGNDYVAKRAGQINEETHYVLQKFGVKVPTLLENVKLQVKDMDIHQIDGIGPNVSMKDTWIKMKENNIKTIPILRDEELLGVISTGDIATSYMDVYDNMILSKAKTQYRNIMNTLDGEMVTGNEHGYFTKGKAAIGASSPELMQEFIEKDDLVILGNRVESQMCALDIDVSCMVVCQNAEVSKEVIKRADEQSTVIISTPHDTFTAARLINQSVPVNGMEHSLTEVDIVHEVKQAAVLPAIEGNAGHAVHGGSLCVGSLTNLAGDIQLAGLQGNGGGGLIRNHLEVNFLDRSLASVVTVVSFQSDVASFASAGVFVRAASYGIGGKLICGAVIIIFGSDVYLTHAQHKR